MQGFLAFRAMARSTAINKNATSKLALARRAQLQNLTRLFLRSYFVCLHVLSESIQRTLHAIGAALQHVRVDHGGADIGVAQQLLDGADIVAGFEQMGGKAMAKGVATNFFGETGVDDGRLDPLLEKVLVTVMTAEHVIAGAWIDAESARGEEKLPAQLGFGGGEFLGEGVGEPDAAVATPEIAFVDAADLDDLFLEAPLGSDGERDDAIFFPLAIADHDLLAGEIDIFDAEPAAFEDAEAGAVEEFGLKKFDSI
jgi:hypothetical protein